MVIFFRKYILLGYMVVSFGHVQEVKKKKKKRDLMKPFRGPES